MSKRIITISREFGSGGRTIGKKVAERLGIAFYDKELIEMVAEKTGYDQKFIEQKGEYADYNNIFSYAFIGRDQRGMSNSDYLFAAQRQAIVDIAAKEPCVIVGRCADYILQDRDDVLNVFIHANEKSKVERIVKLYGETNIKPEKRLKDKDKKRAVNYKYYTDQEWGKASNYHVTLDSSAFGIEKCVELIVDLAK